MKHIATKFSFFLKSLCIMLFACAYSGHSQSIWIEEPDGDTEIGVDVKIPSLDGFNAEGAAFATYLYSHIPVSDNFTLQLDLPVSHFSNGGGESNFAVGNPYAGLQIGGPNSATKFDIGVRLPLADETSGALTSGLIAENYKIGSFFPDLFSIISNIHYRYENESGLIVRLGGGPELVIPSEDDDDFFEQDNELFAKYYGQLLYAQNNFTFGGGLTGQAIISEEDLSFGERSVHNFGFTGSYEFDTVTTGAYFEIPLDDDLNDFLNYVVGINIGFDI